MGIAFPILLADPGLPNPVYRELFSTWELDALYPTLVILDGEGIVRFRASGPEGTRENQIDLEAAFDLIGRLLDEAAAQQP